jgi:SAM-dependent methyltransferase
MKHEHETVSGEGWGDTGSSNTREQALYFADLSRRAIEALGSVLLQTVQRTPANATPAAKSNSIGQDLDATELKKIDDLFSGHLKDIEPYVEAQIRELAFWRWVAFEGYGNIAPQAFPYHQELLMVSTFYKTGWSLHEFLRANVLEVGCGPLGIIEFLPAEIRVAFDPLNSKYDKLFANHRSPRIRYIGDRDDLTTLPSNFDLALCHNVLDHTSDPDFWFNTLFDKLRDDARFLIQLNLTLPALHQSEEHRRMHPSPFTYDQIMSWLSTKSSKFKHILSPEPTPDGEAYFLAWGKKTSNTHVSYSRLL